MGASFKEGLQKKNTNTHKPVDSNGLQKSNDNQTLQNVAQIFIIHPAQSTNRATWIYCNSLPAAIAADKLESNELPIIWANDGQKKHAEELCVQQIPVVVFCDANDTVIHTEDLPTSI